MPGDAGSIQYSLRQPFDRAVASVCSSLTSRGLQLAGQLDMSKRVKRSLGIVLPACSIVFVLPDVTAPGTASIHPWAAVHLPLHVVFLSQGAQTKILLQNRVHAGLETGAAQSLAQVTDVQAEVAMAIETIAMRQSLAG